MDVIKRISSPIVLSWGIWNLLGSGTSLTRWVRGVALMSRRYFSPNLVPIISSYLHLISSNLRSRLVLLFPLLWLEIDGEWRPLVDLILWPKAAPFRCPQGCCLSLWGEESPLMTTVLDFCPELALESASLSLTNFIYAFATIISTSFFSRISQS